MFFATVITVGIVTSSQLITDRIGLLLDRQASELLALLRKGHYDVKLDTDDWQRLITWMDTYGQRQGAFSRDQEEELRRLRHRVANLLVVHDEKPLMNADER